MYIERLYLRNFRNYQEESFIFFNEINLIRGANAQGKTSLLEALFLIGTGRSFRTTYLKELIYKEASFFFMESQFKKDGIEQIVRVSFDGEIKKLEMNHTFYSHFNPLLGLLPIVLLTPEDIRLISGTPSDRRRFLDLHLAQSDPLYVFHLTRYHKAVKHRNFILRQKKQEGLEPWESIMVASAVYIRRERSAFIEEIRADLQQAMQALSKEKDQIEIRYQSSFTDNYAKHRSREIFLGSTLLGPHRDDLEIFINSLSASSYASQGQIRSAIAALRVAEWKRLYKQHQISPLFCIDDFGVHLDEARREALLSQLTDFGQVFLTSSVFLENRPYHTLQIESGHLLH